MENRMPGDGSNKILDFAASCRHVYIYGAGNFGRGYLDILQHNGQDADGFIVTEKHSSEYMGKPIYSIDEISRLISAEDGIIPAFTNSSIPEIAGISLLRNKNCHFHCKFNKNSNLSIPLQLLNFFE